MIIKEIRPPGDLFISNPFVRGGGGALFNLETAMVSVLYKELECKVGEVGGHVAEDQKQIQTFSW